MTRTHREVASILLRLRMKDRPRRLALDGSDKWKQAVLAHRDDTMIALSRSGLSEEDYKMERWRLRQQWMRNDADIARWNARIKK